MFATGFSIAGQHYAINNMSIVRILPRLAFHSIPSTPPYILGFFEHESSLIPAIDVACLLYEKPTKLKLGNRILLANYTFSNECYLIGLLVETDVHLIDIEEKWIMEAPIKSPNAPFLGSIIKKDNFIIQLITLEGIINPSLVQQFFQPS